jgi:glycosyltransferase involved in cell wall biosynthesis
MFTFGRIVFKPCVLIPVYNHEHAVGNVIKHVLAHNVPCVLVDDGSNMACASVLEKLAAQHSSQIMLARHARNEGKGAAVMTGMQQAFSAGFSHALQIDADGQHDTDDIPRFMEMARAHPEAVVAGYPIYDGSVPQLRLYGRYLTHAWAWINTLSFTIRDSMCGFRLYPLNSAVALIKRHPLEKRMAFDTDIIVRLYWEETPIINLPTKVHYPQDGVSHFQMLRDNVQISGMHARLFFGMLRRIPKLLRRKRKR